MHTLAHPRFVGIETVGGPCGIYGYFAARCQGLIIVSTVPIRGPLPYIPCHIEQAVSISRERAHRSSGCVSVFARIRFGEVALKRISHVLTTGPELVAPSVAFAIESAT